MACNVSPQAREKHPLTDEERAAWVKAGKNPDLPVNHPINALSPLRKLLILLTLSYAAMLSNFAIAIILVAFGPMGHDFHKSPGEIPATIGYGLLGVAVGPLIWNPLARTCGRRVVYLLGSFLTIPCCIWLAESRSYAVFAVGRVVAGIMAAFSQTVPPSTVADIFVPEVRGDKMSMYGVAVVIAPAVAPLFSGLIVHATTWRVLFWFILGLSGLQLLLVIFLVPETLWVEDPHDDAIASPATTEMVEVKREAETQHHRQETYASHVRSGHVGAAWMPWQRPREFLGIFLGPIKMLQYASITIPSFYYGSLFAWSVGITVVVPQVFEHAPYSFATIPLGCSFLAFGIGGVLGKWSGGIVGDKVVAHLEEKHGRREPEDRLWALLPILPFMFGGLIIVGACIQKELHWIGILIGGALYYFCLSAATGVLQTYTMECFISRSGDCGVVFMFWKMMWGFAVAYFAMQWGLKDGFLTAYAVQGALAAVMGILVCGVFIWKGKEIRMKQGMPEFEK